MKKVLIIMGLMAVGSRAVKAGPPTFDFTNPDAGAASVPIDGGAGLLLAAEQVMV